MNKRWSFVVTASFVIGALSIGEVSAQSTSPLSTQLGTPISEISLPTSPQPAVVAQLTPDETPPPDSYQEDEPTFESDVPSTSGYAVCARLSAGTDLIIDPAKVLLVPLFKESHD